jgi:hypothetical protein
VEDRSLALELEDAPVNQGLAGKITGIVQEVLGGEIIGPIEDQVIVPYDPVDIGRGEAFLIGGNGDTRIQGLDRFLGRFSLGSADILAEIWRIWRCRLLKSTLSESTIPSLPTPAAAR